MNRKYFFLLLVYQLVAYSSFSDVENHRFKSERNRVQLVLVKMCESRIPSLMSGVLLGGLGFSFGAVTDMLNHLSGSNKVIPLATRGGVAGFVVGYASVAIGQYFILKKFEIK